MPKFNRNCVDKTGPRQNRTHGIYYVYIMYHGKTPLKRFDRVALQLIPVANIARAGAPRKSCKVSRHWEMFGSSAKAEPRAWKLTLKSMLYSTLLYTVYLCWPMFDLCSCSFSMFFIDLSFCCTKTSGKLGIPDPKSQKGAEVGAVLIGCNLCLAKTKYEISKIWYSMVYTV